MITLTQRQLPGALKSIHGLLASAGTLLPALGFFMAWAPPFLQGWSLLLTPLAMAIVIVTFPYQGPEEHLPKACQTIRRRAMLALLAACTFLILYTRALDCWTVVVPHHQVRIQIGFGLLHQGLTPCGQGSLDASQGQADALTLLSGGLFQASKVWKRWTISTAGTGLALLFGGGFFLWVYGWTLLAKFSALQAIADRPPREA